MKNLNRDVPFISFLRLEQIKDYSEINDNLLLVYFKH